MARTVAIGIQNFRELIEHDYFYIDKTSFIKEWWNSGDAVTLIARPRRFGKTLTMSMVEYFFSVQCKKQDNKNHNLFSNYNIGTDKYFQKIQGTYPVLNMTLGSVKESTMADAEYAICEIVRRIFSQHLYIIDSDILSAEEKNSYKKLCANMNSKNIATALNLLSEYLYRYYHKKVIILLDEYDTPMHEAYVQGYWNELMMFMRRFFNATFKTNPYMERAILTGITRISKESVFSDLNNLKVVTTTSDEYASSFGFTEEEVFTAMDEYGLQEKDKVKLWYDGFIFGSVTDIYNPWSIINYLDTGKLNTYWANTSANGLVGKLIREGNRNIKMLFEELLKGHSIKSDIAEDIVFDQLDTSDEAVWSLLLASGYLKVTSIDDDIYSLALTNYEIKKMFQKMIRSWFGKNRADYNDFVKALLAGDLKSMNFYMNEVALAMISSFDTGIRPSRLSPERFYHGFVLGLLVEISDTYYLTSNRESGYGRYDILLEPHDKSKDGIILEFKVYDSEEENDLTDTVKSALRQIENKKYETNLIIHGIDPRNIRKYGFAFRGKKVLIGQ